MTRLQQILVGLLAVQVVLAVALLWPRPAPAGAGGAALLAIKADDITALTVRDNQGKSVKLAKTGEGWVLPEAGDYPADATKITPLLAKLAELKSSRLVAQTPGSYKRLQVADDAFVRRLDLETSGGTKTLLVGSSAGPQAVHVRVGGQEPVYLANGLADWELGADSTSWINPVYFSVAPADAVAITLGNANGQWTFEKDAQGNWTMKELTVGETLNPDAVAGLVNLITSVRMTRPLGKNEDAAYGLAQPSALVTISAKSGDQTQNYTLTIGAKDANDNTYVVKSSESPYYVRVADYNVKDLVERKREGFLKLPPTPVPAGVQPTATPGQ